MGRPFTLSGLKNVKSTMAWKRDTAFSVWPACRRKWHCWRKRAASGRAKGTSPGERLGRSEQPQTHSSAPDRLLPETSDCRSFESASEQVPSLKDPRDSSAITVHYSHFYRKRPRRTNSDNEAGPVGGLNAGYQVLSSFLREKLGKGWRSRFFFKSEPSSVPG